MLWRLWAVRLASALRHAARSELCRHAWRTTWAALAVESQPSFVRAQRLWRRGVKADCSDGPFTARQKLLRTYALSRVWRCNVPTHRATAASPARARGRPYCCSSACALCAARRRSSMAAVASEMARPTLSRCPRALATASWLTCLDLSDNDLRATGTQSLCAALEVLICSAHVLAAQSWADLPVRAIDTPQHRCQQVPSSTSYSIATTWEPSKPSTNLSNGPMRTMQAGRHPDKMRGISETRQRR